LAQLLQNSVWRFLKKLKIELAYDPAMPLLSIYPKKCTSAYSRDPYTFIDVHESSIHNTQTMESDQVPINRRMDKKKMWYRYNRVLLSHKEK
jgi:hypothetical protein